MPFDFMLPCTSIFLWDIKSFNDRVEIREMLPEIYLNPMILGYNLCDYFPYRFVGRAQGLFGGLCFLRTL